VKRHNRNIKSNFLKLKPGNHPHAAGEPKVRKNLD
jgi:hypothetical protein